MREQPRETPGLARIRNWTMKPIAALILAASLTACAAEPKPPSDVPPVAGRQCFWANNVTSFQAVDDTHVNIRVGVKDVYQMTLFGRCSEIDWASRIALRAHDSSLICTAMDVEVISPSSLGPERCPIHDIRKLTTAEIAALPAKERP
jgi:hypothetical protein